MKTLGCDVSFWNGEVDFVKMKSAGASFCYIKASQLTKDTRVDEYHQKVKDTGILYGFYHFLDWRMSELEQARLFVDSMAGDYGNLPPICDFEMTNYAPDPAVANGKLWNFLQYVEKETGRIPGIYTGFFYWLQYGTPNIGWAKYPFWLAWYAAESIIKVPPPWTKWTFWQYTGNGNGPQYGSTGLSMDMDWFNGSLAELQALAGAPIPTPAPVLTQEQRITKLEQAARDHGWQI